jgi:hypothetical protein
MTDSNNNINEKHIIIPYRGIDNIRTEESKISEVLDYFGEADSYVIDDRGNIEIVYEKKGLVFKSLESLNSGIADPNISLIKINDSFKSKEEKAIFPGLEKHQVSMRMRDLQASVVEKEYEVWEDDAGKKMKFIYNELNILESIIIY